jgi:hypothetical protein
MSLTESLYSKLPFDIIREILLYDERFVIRKKENYLVCINKISKLDERYLLLSKIPKIYQLASNSWSVILGINKRYILKHYLRPSNIWEYNFVTFSKDPNTNSMCSIPDSMICIPLFSLQN